MTRSTANADAAAESPGFTGGATWMESEAIRGGGITAAATGAVGFFTAVTFAAPLPTTRSNAMVPATRIASAASPG
jgi:hypothetical protein